MAVFAIVALALCASVQATNPIAKVVQMLGDLEAKIIKEGEVAQKVFSDYSEWCEDRSRNVGFEIKTAQGEVADLKATIQKETADSAALTAKIDELAGSIGTNDADQKAATHIRAKEAADFAAEDKELGDVVNTLERAIAIISREMQGGASMVQLKNAGNIVQALKVMVEAHGLSSKDGSQLTALVQSSQESDSDDADAGAPDAAVYESQSGNIVGTLQGLLDKAESQQADARKKESTEKHNFEMLSQSLDDEIRFANDDMAAAKKALAGSGESKSAAEGNLEVTSKDLAADIAQKADLHHDCLTKAEEFEACTKSRAEELEALAQAKKVIKENTGGAEDLEYGLSQTSFVQRSALSSGSDLAHFEAVRFVRDLARKQNSPQLAQLASRMATAMRMEGASGDDPFAKVKGLISDMLARLEESAAADATEKSYCDKELSESNAKKDDKNAEIAKLSTSIDQMTSKSAHLKEQVSALNSQLADLAASQAGSDKYRQEEHAAFVTNQADMSQGLEGVKLALNILRDYYATEGKAHGAAEGAGAGIVGLLEVCESDFSKSLAEITTNEETAQGVYDRVTKENAVDKTVKDQDVMYKSAESVRLDKAVAEATSDRSGVQAELDAILEYLVHLKGRCVAVAETYGERKARRDAELAGLKQALDILESQAALVQTSERRSLRHAKLHVA